ncbi:uncharacterized protein LOC121415918 [Lytechinus variegatus]|uniref:uncharacterized protein LOC121415918 n=1 Tax=Lytechinus variegatus TaxID=7654 RepID=UPI001BB216D6|nr:uncharacterized protein LOC121415918 [Lytechinus variegatus]
MPTAVVTVRWLQPPRYRGMEETVSRSRVRQRGPLSVGEEVRVRYKRSYYKAEIIDNGEVPSSDLTNQTGRSASPPASPPRLQDPLVVSSPDSPPRPIATVPPPQLLYFDPLTSTPLVPPTLPHHHVDVDESALDGALVFYPVSQFQLPPDSLLDSAEVPFPEQSPWELATPAFEYSITDSVPGTELDADVVDSDVDSYDSDVDSYYSDGSEDVPNFIPSQESDEVAREHAQRMIDNHIRLRSSTTEPTSSVDYHECIEDELLEGIVRSAEASPDHEDSTLSTVQRFHIFLSQNIKRIDEELMPRVASVTAFMLEDEVPCLRCIINLTKTTRRLEALRDNLAIFLTVATRTMHTATEE